MGKFNEQMPVYLQIMQIIKADIVTGDLKLGEKLPSVREMSEKLMVNPNTMQRVFMELERENIVYSQRGKGTFVSDKLELIENLRITQAEKYSIRYLEEMKELGIKKREILNLLTQMMEGD
ncbi:MAG TPA: GntR family transcriptional regulator [Clostridiaceae bacterium]